MRWVRDRDPGFLALRRAARAAVVMPAMFAVADKVIGNPAVATFTAFGSFAMLVLVDFGGRLQERLEAQAALAVAGAVLVCLGTLASRSTPLAAVSMTVVAFAVLFAGVVSSVLAGASTSLLLAFILPVSIPAPASAIPDRLAGWGLAAAAGLVAISVLWPAPARNPVLGAAITACRALAARLRADVTYVLGAASAREWDAAVADANRAVAALGDVFFATPYRPTGLSTSARTVVRLVDELRWLNAIVVHSAPTPTVGRSRVDERACEVKSAAALVLERGAEQLDDPRREPDSLRDAQAALARAGEALEAATVRRLPRIDGAPVMRQLVSALDPSFRAQELSFAVAQVATNIDFAAAADRRSWADRLLGRQPRGLTTTLSVAQERAGSHAARQSVWLQNSVRGAVGLGLAVLVSQLASVDHAFWVVLGALSVLRSNALNTGQTVVRAVAGTAAGFVVGALIIAVVGTNTALLWFLLPPAVLAAALVPATISFAIGQAAFTVTLLILFNILQPQGWQVGLVRVEDVVLGSAVSLLVGFLFWPRGAAAALGQALAQAYSASASYLTRAVEFGMGRCDGQAPASGALVVDAGEAAAASRRLDDTFRTYLGERGAKSLPLAEVASLVTGVAGLRLAGDAVLDLWQGAAPMDGDRSAARRELMTSAESVRDWYDEFAASLIGHGDVPDPLTSDDAGDGRLLDAVSHDLVSTNGQASATGVRMIWTGDHLDAARRLQSVLVTPARAAVGAEDGRETARSP
jgi:uncharacterized membrane protein YccC